MKRGTFSTDLHPAPALPPGHGEKSKRHSQENRRSGSSQVFKSFVQVGLSRRGRPLWEEPMRVVVRRSLSVGVEPQCVGGASVWKGLWYGVGPHCGGGA